MSLVTVETEGVVMRIALNRPDKLNALNTAMRRAMIAALEEAETDDVIRVVVLQGNGRGFCAGQDVAEIQSRDETGIPIDEEFHRLFVLLHRYPKPLIVRWHGPVAGAGLQLSLLCDLRIAGEGARIGMTEINLGMPVLIGSRLLSAVVGDGAMRRLILYADFVDGAEAARMGLATEVLPDADVDARIVEIAAGLAARNPELIHITKAGWTEETQGWFDEMWDQSRRLGKRLDPVWPERA